jgi:hypothetical protein
VPTPVPKTNQTLRKAFRKTLATASGFRVRMRTVFVPYVLLPSSGGMVDEEDAPAAGMAESTVMLCVELENLGEASGGGFAVEAVDVDVSGDGARATLIRWDASKSPEQSFPIRLGAYEQYNLLYAVSFVRSADADDSAPADLQRAVAIYVHGRPYEMPSADAKDDPATFRYPSKQFSSRWNCVLDLDPRRNRESHDYGGGGAHEVLPEPASPFPVAESPQTATLGAFSAQQQNRMSAPAAVAGSKRHTLAAIATAASRLSLGNAPVTASGAAPVNYRSGTSMLNPAFQAERDREREATAGALMGGPKRGPSPIPPSLVLQQTVQQARTPTTYSFPQGVTSPKIRIGSGSDGSVDGQFASMPPPTPAYPAYPAAPQTPNPFSQAPLANNQAGVGPAVEIRRDRGAAQGARSLIPPTPGPIVTSGFNVNGGGLPGSPMNLAQQGTYDGAVVLSPRGHDDDKLVVSIGLLPKQPAHDHDEDDDDYDEAGARRLYPLDRFTLDIFVFNQSAWTRRLELSCPNSRQRRKDRPASTGYFPPAADTHLGKLDAPGMVALENRVRIG